MPPCVHFLVPTEKYVRRWITFIERAEVRYSFPDSFITFPVCFCVKYSGRRLGNPADSPCQFQFTSLMACSTTRQSNIDLTKYVSVARATNDPPRCLNMSLPTQLGCYFEDNREDTRELICCCPTGATDRDCEYAVAKQSKLSR